MYRKTSLLLLSALLILGLAAVASNVPFHAYAQGTSQPDAPSVRIVEAGEHRLVIELSLPSFESETIIHDGVAYQRLRVAEWPHWGQPGQPQLPMHSVPLGMPGLGTPQLAVLETESQVVEGVWLYPVPGLELGGGQDTPRIVETFVLDAEAYSADISYPGPLAEATSIGFLRDQPLFQLRLYPFQYNPQRRELRVYRRLKLQVTFPEGNRSLVDTGRAPASPVFERILERVLLNYDTLPQPQATRSVLPGRVPLAAPASGPQVKLSVVQSGLYRVAYEDVLPVAPDLLQRDPRHLVLSNQGTTIPILFEGEADGSFDPGDSFVFYGQAIDSVYTWQNVYWLSDSGAPGLRLSQRDGTPGTGTPPTAFTDHRHYEEDLDRWRGLPGSEDEDHWFWDLLSVSTSTPVSADYTFDLHHIETTGPDGQLRLMLYGYTIGHHLTQIYLNDVALLSPTSQAWRGQVPKLYEIPVSPDSFVEGTNRLRVENILPEGEAISGFFVNWFEVSYQDTYVAEEDQIAFSAPAAGTYTFEVTGFVTDCVELFDITDPAAPVRVISTTVELDGGSYRLRFADSATADGRYLAQRVDQLPTPPLRLDEPSAWRSPANGATVLMITHPDFYDALQPLATYRSGQGETVAVVKTEDACDEFNYGIYDPHPIRSLIEYAYHNWSPRPVYVLLVGDASMDPKNHTGSAWPDLLPTYYVNTPVYGLTADDGWYAKVHGDDDYPDVIVGRIPARYASEVATVIDKVLVHEGSPPAGEWMRRAVLVADDGDPEFAEDMDMVASTLPETMVPIRMFDYDPGTSVQDEVSAGALLLAYSGHGNELVWGMWEGDHRILALEHISTLDNGNRLPFVTIVTCLNGRFDMHHIPRAMAEEFLLVSNRGGIASWAPAGLGFPTENNIILEELYQALLVDGDLTLGSAVTTARVQAYLREPDMLNFFETLTYFGDPAVRLSLPATLGLEGQTDPDPAVMGESLGYTLVYTVSGADRARGLTLVNTLPQGVTYQSASPPPSSIYGQSQTWNLGDRPAGSYTVNVTARVSASGLAHGQILHDQVHLSDANGGSQDLQIETAVHDSPIAGLSAGNDSPTELGDATVFSATTTSGTNVVYTWDFGDGSPPQTGMPIQHVYPAIGTYTAWVTATNGVSSRSQTTTVTITDVPPVASFTSSSPDVLGQTSRFWSTSAGTNLAYRWDFGDGSPPVSGEGGTITHTYAHLGTYTVVLTASNSVGSSIASGTIEIKLYPDPPVASFTSSSPDQVGQPTVFVNTSLDGGDDEENVSYAWDLGDGTSSAAQHPAHTYATVGTYLVSLTATNSFASDTFRDTVLVTDVPIGGLAIDSDSPTTLGAATTFSATATSGTNISYLWAFGDGAFSTSQYPTHGYGAVGSYVVVLTATNGVGSQVLADTVQVVDEPIEGLRISHSGPTPLGSSTAFTAVTTAGTNLAYLWDLGDGVTSTLQSPVHTYPAIGEYTVVLTATNGWGSQVRFDAVSVRDVPISGLSVIHDGPTMLGTATTFTAAVAAGTNVIYNWNLGDGQTGVGAHLAHTYAGLGTYSVTVRAVNGTSESVASTRVTMLDPDLSIFLPLVLRGGPS